MRSRRPWIMCAACTLLMFTTMGLCSTAFYAYNPYLAEAGGLNNSQISLLSTVRGAGGIAALAMVTRLHRAVGLRFSALASSLGCAAGMLLFSGRGSFASYCAASAISGFSYSAGGMLLVSVVMTRWFGKNRALAIGICSAGGGAASVVAPPVAAALIKSHSLAFSLRAEAVFVLAAGAVVFAVLRDRPESAAAETPPRGPRGGRTTAAGTGRGLSAAGTARMMLSFAVFSAVSGGGFSSTSMLFRTAGYGGMTAAALLSLQGAALTSGKVLFGRLADRFGARRAGTALFALDSAACVLLCFSGSGIAAAASGAALLGLGVPLSTVGLPLFAAELSSPEKFDRSLQLYNIALSTGSLFNSALPGAIADRTGSYAPYYALAAALSAVSAALVLRSYREMRIRAKSRPAGAGAAL